MFLAQEFPQRLPIMRMPSLIKMVEVTFGKASVIQYDSGLGIQSFQFKLNQRISSLGKLLRQAPRLHDPLVRHQFNVAPPTNPPNIEKLPPGLGSISAAAPENALKSFELNST